MKTHRSFVFLSLLPALALAFDPLAATERRVAYPAENPGVAAPVRAIGMARGDLWSMLGEPSARLTRDIWIYFDYKSTIAADIARNFDTLVVVFTADRVSGMKLTAQRTVLALLARSQTAAAALAMK